MNVNLLMAKGVAWMALFKLLGRSLSLISVVVLARLLAPADFGMVAMAMSIIAIIDLLSSFSFDVFLIQKQDAGRDDYDSAWTLNLIVRLLVAVLIVALALPTAAFYSEPKLTAVLLVLSIGFAISGVENIGIVDFRRDMRFDREFAFSILKRLGGFLVTIPLAFWWRNYWALVAGTVMLHVGGVVLSYMMSPYRPRWCLSGWRALFRFSKWLFFNNALAAFRERTAHFVLGRVSGPEPLGVFTVSYTLANMPTTELVAPINRAVFPGYAKMAADRAVLQEGYINVIRAIALIALPASFGLAATAELFVPVLLGDKWLPAIPVIQVLSFYAGLVCLQSNAGAAYMALGVPHWLTVASVIFLLVLIPLVIAGAGGHLGTDNRAVGAAYAYLIAALVFALVHFVLVVRVLGVPAAALLGGLWRPALAALAMFAVVVVQIHSAGDPAVGLFGQITALLLAAAMGVLVYAAGVWLLWIASGRPSGIEQFLLSKAAAVAGRFTAKLRRSEG